MTKACGSIFIKCPNKGKSVEKKQGGFPGLRGRNENDGQDSKTRLW
jgi:hypothetical protein